MARLQDIRSLTPADLQDLESRDLRLFADDEPSSTASLAAALRGQPTPASYPTLDLTTPAAGGGLPYDDAHALQLMRIAALRGQQGAPADAAPQGMTGGQQALALFDQMTGNPALAQFGNAALGQQAHASQLASQNATHVLQRALEAERTKQLEAYQAARIDEAKRKNEADEALKAQGLGQSDVVVTHDAAGNPIRVHKSGGPIPSGAPAATAAAPSDDGLPPLAPMKPKDVEAAFQKLSDTVSTVKGRANLNAENQKRLYSAERLEALVLGPNGQLQNLTPQQLREASTALANLISQGAVSEHQIEELTPSTLAGKWAQLKQKVLNEPQGADAQAFLQNMLDTAAREKGTTLRQMHAGQLQGIPNLMHLRRRDQGRFDGILRGAGLEPSQLDAHGLPVQQAAPTAGGPTHYLISPDKKWRVPADASGKAIGPKEPNPNG